MAIKDVILGYAKGEKGDQGPQGAKGETGATGPKGDPGNIADAQITDTEGLDVAKGQKTTAQKLFDAIANRIVTKLVTNDALTEKLADYMLKGMMSNTNVNNIGTVPTSALLYSMFEQINNNLGNTGKYLRTDNIDNAAKTLWPKIEGSSSYDFTWIPENAGGITAGARARVIGSYINSEYEVQMALSYSSSAPVVQREKINGSWGEWKVFVTKSDLKVLKKHDVQFSNGFAEISFPGITYDSAVCINQEYKSSDGVQNLVFTAQVRPNELIIYARNTGDGSIYNGILDIMVIAIG